MPTKIAIDCHTLEIKNWAGKEQFLASLIKSLSRQTNTDKTFILYFRKKVNLPYSLPNNFVIKTFNFPTPIWQFRILLDMVINRVRLLLVPCTYLLSYINFFIKQIVIVHDLTTFLPEIRINHKFLTVFKEKLLLKRSLKNAIKVVAVSKNTSQDIQNILNIKKDKIEMIYEAAKNYFRPIDNDDKLKEVLHKYNIYEKYILSVGTLEPRKNLINIFLALEKLEERKEFEEYKLVVVGQEGWCFKESHGILNNLKVKKKIIFTGYVHDDDMPFLYSGAKCFVYPSLYEGFGLPILEAMACGCPVITSNNSSLPEVGGRAVSYVNPKDKDQIYTEIKNIINGEERTRQLILQGKQQAKKFSWEKTSEQYLNLFDKILD